MWFLFGFITLISFSLYVAYKKINAGWSGTSIEVEGHKIQYKKLVGKYGITGLLVGIEGATDHDFIFKNETWYDRFFKSIGVSLEHQIGNAEFDDNVYIVSDDATLLNVVSQKKQLVDAVLTIFNTSKIFNSATKQVRCNSGRLWVKLSTKSGFDEGEVFKLSGALAKELLTIKGILEKIIIPKSVRWRDPFVLKSIAILAVSSGLAINGILHLSRLLYWDALPITLDAGSLFRDSLQLGILIITALMVFSLYLLGRSARTHLVLIELLLVGTFGAVSTSYVEFRDMNIEFDSSPEIIYESKLLRKRISRGRRSTSYYMYIKDWQHKGGEIKLDVSRQLYRSFSGGDKLSIAHKSGYLGYGWIKAINKR